MALLAEQIVEEWLRREGFFTIRGLKLGIEEIDLLAIRPLQDGKWDNLHVEVQVSIRPVTYIADLNKDKQREFDISASRSAKKRTDFQQEAAVIDWVKKKYFAEIKKEKRRELTPFDNWRYMFVHGKVKKDSIELKLIGQQGIEIKDIKDVLHALYNDKPKFTTSSATDIIELLHLTKNIENFIT